eukprot:jgi/Hompol1/4422/HPOL_007096-RA
MSISLSDPTIPVGVQGITINLFRRTISELPPITQNGAIVRIVVRLQKHQSRLQGVSPSLTQLPWTLFANDVASNNAEQAVVDHLRAWWRWQTATGSRVPYKTFEPVRKYTLISELQIDKFSDIYAQVVSVGPSPSSSRRSCIVALTDYTQHSMAQSGGDLHLAPQFPPQILDRAIVNCEFWDISADAAANLRVGQYIEIRNTRCKFYMSLELS